MSWWLCPLVVSSFKKKQQYFPLQIYNMQNMLFNQQNEIMDLYVNISNSSDQISLFLLNFIPKQLIR